MVGGYRTLFINLKKINILCLIFTMLIGIVSCSSDQAYVTKLTDIAERGDGEACWCLYLYYYDRKDSTKSDYWLQKGANYGYARAQANWSAHLIYGDSPKKKAEGIKFLIKAAEQNLWSAQAELGNLYRDGEEVPRDIKKSIYWYRKAAKNADPDAMFNLAEILIANQKDNDSYIEAYCWAIIGIAKEIKTALRDDQKNLPDMILAKAKKAGLNDTLIKQKAELQAKEMTSKLPMKPRGDEGVDAAFREKCNAKVK
jgi:TPR repeat protein